MESYDEARRESHLYKAREPEESCNNELAAKIAELTKTKEELKRAKDNSTQSWLDSRPLIDELEKLQSALASAQNRFSMSNIVISELETQLETTNTSIKSKKEEELKARNMIDEMSQALDQTREEMDRVKMEMDEERRARLKLKQVLRIRRQTLRTLLLTIRAIRLESEAFGASEAEALRHINRSEMDNTTVQLTQEEYYVLTRKAKEETSLADWRLSVSMEQRLVAEASRDTAFERFKELYSGSKSRKRVIMKEEKVIGDGNTTRDAEKDSRVRERDHVNSRRIAYPKARANSVAESNQRDPRQKLRRSKTNKDKRLITKKKPSILYQIKSFLVRKIARLFG
ncbi:hypothetical protein L1049_024045 [Liquidambar formosana]|uniref:Uncharacterized protein n=1 Tax=Liquidambar formosana TaxID=63359 RepID=A0AAP0RU93_LIQFO